KVKETDVNRRDLLLHLDDLHRFSGSKGGSTQNQMTFELPPPEIHPSGLPNLTAIERVHHEIEILGMDVSHNRMEFYWDFLNVIGAVRSSDLIAHRSGSSVLVAGIKVALQTPPMRSGK